MSNIVVIGAQWGDEGKAKVIDFLTEQADVVVRFQGGANAGHTVEVGEEKFVFHLIPSGIMRGDRVCVIGNGVVLEPRQLLAEIEELKEKGIEARGRLFIAENAQVVFSYHRLLDQLKEKSAGEKKIGTTGRGIGPAYGDKVNRSGIRVGDLFEREFLRERLQAVVDLHNETIVKVYGEPPIDATELLEEYFTLGEALKPYVCDTVTLLHTTLREGKSLLFEGAQGTILDVDHGTYPFVTSSNTVAGAACCGSGVGPTAIDEVLGVVKAYTTRVGNGPFPTELEDQTGEMIRKIGGEFGATTGRMRRCGWFDAPVVRKSAMVNGLTQLAITKLDVLDTMPEIQICTSYRIDGEIVQTFPSQLSQLEKVEPVYETVPGWQSQTSEIQNYDSLPDNAKKYLNRISELIQVPVSLVSLGPKRHQTVTVSALFCDRL